MNTDIYAGKRVLYKQNSGWQVGELLPNGIKLNSEGLYFNVMDLVTGNMESNILFENLFLDGEELQDWQKDMSNGVLFTVEDFIEQVLEDEDFSSNEGKAYMSDGEYYYYPVSKLNKTWLKKQNLHYVAWFV